MKLCEVCNNQTSLYRCPRCFTNTCSLKCCVEHKTKKGCNGKRNRAAYCAIENFTDSHLASDYHFLEDVLNVAQSGKRLFNSVTTKTSNNKNMCSSSKRNKTITMKNADEDDKTEDHHAPIQPLLRLAVSTNSQPGEAIDIGNNNDKHNTTSWMHGQLSFKQQRLVQQARERGCTLLLMPTGMERQRNNTTVYSPKQDIITWKIEWIFHFSQQGELHSKTDQPNLQTCAHCNKNSLVSTEIICDNQVPESVILKEYLLKHLVQGKHAKSTLQPFRSALTLSQNIASNSGHTTNSQHNNTTIPLPCSSKSNINRVGKDDIEDPFPLLLFMKQIPCSSATPIYTPLDPNQTVKAALHGKTLIEFPTIDVVLPCDSHLIPCLVKEV